MRSWGYRHCGIWFQQYYQIDPQGRLHWKGEYIPWEEITAVRRLPPLVGNFLRWPHTTFFLGDGRSFTVRTSLEEAGRKTRPSFTLVAKSTAAYREFVGLVEDRSNATNFWRLRASRYEALWFLAALGGGIAAKVLFEGRIPFEGAILTQVLGLLLGAFCGWIAQRALRKRALRAHARLREKK